MPDNEPRDRLANEDVRAIATAWMLLGWTVDGLTVAENHSCADTCEPTGTGWYCIDETGESRHPEADALAEACEMANLAIETLEGRGWRPPPRRIETDEELAAVAPMTIVHAADGTIAARHPSGVGVLFGDKRPFDWSLLRAPATVLREPEEANR